MNLDVDVFRVVMVAMDGRRRLVPIGFASNGTMWIETRANGISPEDAGRLWGNLDEVVLMDHRRQLLFVNAVALAGLMDDPQLREHWLSHVGELIEKYKHDQALYGSPERN